MVCEFSTFTHLDPLGVNEVTFDFYQTMTHDHGVTIFIMKRDLKLTATDKLSECGLTRACRY